VNRGARASLVQRAVSAAFAFAGHLVVVFFLILFLLIAGHHVRDRIVEIALLTSCFFLLT
jgi:hypothetical protein